MTLITYLRVLYDGVAASVDEVTSAHFGSGNLAHFIVVLIYNLHKFFGLLYCIMYSHRTSSSYSLYPAAKQTCPVNMSPGGQHYKAPFRPQRRLGVQYNIHEQLLPASIS
jgi:hypothetical protein